jgi:hypothetical protein
LQYFTRVLIENDDLRDKMSHAARRAAARFARARFVSELSRHAELDHAHDTDVVRVQSSSPSPHELPG